MTRKCDSLNYRSAEAVNARTESVEIRSMSVWDCRAVSRSEPLTLISASEYCVQLPYISSTFAVLRVQFFISVFFALLRVLYAFPSRNAVGATERKCRYE
jgi:hypothetical protein